MPSLPDDCWSNNLSAIQLDTYVSNDPYKNDKLQSVLNKPDGLKKMTPLGAACARGYIDIVRLLIKKGADVNIGAPFARTPLWHATSTCPPKNRLTIVQALIQATGFNTLDEPSGDSVGYTPLMNAVKATRDKDVARLLVGQGADVKKQSRESQKRSAEDMAKNTVFEKILKGTTNVLASLAATVFRALALITHVISWVNSVKEVVSKEGVKEGVVKAYYNITGKHPPSIDPEEKKAEDDVAKLIGKPANITEMKKGLDLYVKDSGLEKFFKPGDPFIQTIAEKAYKLSKDPNAALNTPDGIKRLTQLTFYQSVIYCDDSGSMSSDSPTRYITQCDLVERIARIATMLAPDGSGVHLRFINNASSNKPTASEIMAVMKSRGPGGGTALGSSLYWKILKPLVYDAIATGKPLAQPLLICVITDGCPNYDDNPTFKNAITACKKFLDDKEYDPTAVRYMINQIGEDTSAAAFLRELTNDPQLSDVLYCTTQSKSLDAEFKALRSNEKELDRWLLKTLTAPLFENE